MGMNLTLGALRFSFDFDTTTKTVEVVRMEVEYQIEFRQRIIDKYPTLMEANIGDYGSLEFMIDFDDFGGPEGDFVKSLEAASMELIDELLAKDRAVKRARSLRMKHLYPNRVKIAE